MPVARKYGEDWQSSSDSSISKWGFANLANQLWGAGRDAAFVVTSIAQEF